MDNENLISPLELHEKLDGDDIPPLVIDVRSHDQYLAGHIPDALNNPIGQILDWLNKIPKGRQVVPYCNMHHPGNSSSERAAQQLREVGLEARALSGGFPAWQDAEYPVDTGERARADRA